MRYFLLLLFSVFTTFAVAQTYTVVIDGRLPPGTDFSTSPPTVNWGDGTTTVQGGIVNYEFRNWDRNDPNFNNVQFYEEIPNRTFTQLTLRTVYFPIPPGCTPPSPNFVTHPANLLIPSQSGSAPSFSACNLSNVLVRAIPEMTISGTTGTLCAGSSINLLNTQPFPDEAYTWNFRLRDPMGNPVAGGGVIPSTFYNSGTNSHGAAFNMIDLLGANLASNIGNTVQFYLGAQGYVFSNSVSIVIDDCTPLLQERYPANTSCSTSADGSVEVALQSGLDATENEKLLLTINAVTPEGFVIPEYNVDIFALTSSSNGANTFNLPNLPAGSYEIDYQSEIDPDGDGNYVPNGLGIPFNFQISRPSPVAIDNVDVTQPTCSATATGSATVNIVALSGQDFELGSYEYSMNSGPWQASPNFIGLQQGQSYTFEAKLVLSGGRECVAAVSETISIPTLTNLLAINSGTGISTQPSSPTSNNGALFIRVDNGLNDFTYDLFLSSNPGTSIQTITKADRFHEFPGLDEGTYFVTITDGNTCDVTTIDYTLVAPALPSLESSIESEITCSGDTDGEIQINVMGGTAPYSYQWFRNGALLSTNTTSTDLTFSNLDNGNYELVLASVGIDIDTNPLSSVRSGLIALNNPTPVTIDTFAPSDISCFGANDGSIAVTVSGGTSYEYTHELFPTPTDWTPLAGNTIDNLSGGFYYLTIRNENGCQSATITNTDILIREPDALEVNEVANGHKNVTTNGGNNGAIEINVSGGSEVYTFKWTAVLDNGSVFTQRTTQNITDLFAGKYTVEVTDANSTDCKTTLTDIQVTEPGPLDFVGDLTGTDTCNGLTTGTITATVQGTGEIKFDFLKQPAGTIAYTTTTTDRTVTAPNLAAGTYSLRITEVTSTNSITTPTANYFIISELTPITASDTPTQVTCFGGNDGSITVNAEGGMPPYQYKLNNGAFQTTNLFNNLEAGSYTINVVDNNGCSITPLTTVLDPPTQITFEDTNAITPVSAPGGTDGKISVTVQGGSQPYFYRWTGPGTLTPNNTANTSTINNLVEGTYTLEVSNKATFDIDGCYKTKSYTVTEQDAFSIQSFTGTPTCFNQTNGSLTATIESTGSTTFNWRLENGTLVATETSTLKTLTKTNLPKGNYYLEIVNDNNQRAESFIFEIIELVEVSATVVPIATCNGEATGSITFSNPSGSPSGNYLYSIDDGVNFDTDPIFINLAEGTYTLRVRAPENPNCDYIVPGVTISKSPSIFWDEPNTQITRVSGPGASDGAIAPVFIGGTAPLKYQWSANANNAITQNITGLTAGTYSVTITDAANCAISQSFEVTEVGPLTISNIIPKNATCKDEANGSITTTVTGEGTITYLWTLENGDPVPVSNGVNGPNLSGILAGTYKLTAKDDNATVATVPITITEPATSLTITNIEVSDVSCFEGSNGTLQIEAAGGSAPYTYSLNNGAFQTSPIFNNLTANSYTVRVKDANDCVFTETNPVLVLEPQELNIIINEQRPITEANATNGAIFITVEGGSGNYTYQWTGPNGFTSTQEDILNLAAGNYIVTITDDKYTLNNDTGCRLVSSEITITEPGELLVNLTQTILLECSGDDFAEITANVQGGVMPYTYEWFKTINGNNELLSENSNIIGDLSAGTYFLKVTDANTVVKDSSPIVITAPSLLELTIDTTTNIICAGQATGAINITVTGGTPPYQYFWSNGATVADISGLEAGEYAIDVEDAAGCITQKTVSITAPIDGVQITNASITNASAYQADDGSISVNVSGGLSPYSYVWTKFSDNSIVGNEATISNLTADLYSVSVSDTNGCTVSETYEITQPDLVEATIIQPTCTDSSDASIALIVNQGNGTFNYLWNTGATENNINGLAAGSYTVTISGFSNGSITRTYIIENPIPLEVNLGPDRVLCAGQTLMLDASVEDASASYSWVSTNGFTSSVPNVTLTQSGNYTLTIQSQTGCTAQGTISVEISTEEINAEFAMSSQAFVGETVIGVDISYPLPDGIEWIMPIGAEIVSQNQDAVEFKFIETGEYEIKLITTRGDCIAQKTKKIIVVTNNGLIQEDDSKNGQKLIEEFIVYPNPTSGQFTTDINLTERGDVSVKVFSFANNTLVASKKERGQTAYKIPFDISGMPSGVYAVLLESPYGTSLRKIVIR